MVRGRRLREEGSTYLSVRIVLEGCTYLGLRVVSIALAVGRWSEAADSESASERSDSRRGSRMSLARAADTGHSN